jgi:hypothetical protein
MFRLSEHCASTISERCFHWWFKLSVTFSECLRKFRVFTMSHLPLSNCPLKLKSPRSLWNIRNRQSPNGTPRHSRSVHPQVNGCENWALHNGRQRLSLCSNDVVRSTPNSVRMYVYIMSYGTDKAQFTICRKEVKLKFGGCNKNEIFYHMFRISAFLVVNYYKACIYLLWMTARNREW